MTKIHGWFLWFLYLLMAAAIAQCTTRGSKEKSQQGDSLDVCYLLHGLTNCVIDKPPSHHIDTTDSSVFDLKA
jgi:hypothetical protein